MVYVNQDNRILSGVSTMDKKLIVGDRLEVEVTKNATLLLGTSGGIMKLLDIQVVPTFSKTSSAWLP